MQILSKKWDWFSRFSIGLAILVAPLSYATKSSPTELPAFQQIRYLQVSAGYQNTCALSTTNDVWCWGSNQAESVPQGDVQNAVGFTPTPSKIPNLTNVLSIASGNDFTCFLMSDESVECMGANAYGQIGNDSTSPSSSPTPVFGISSAVQISAGADSACAVLASGEVACWGSNVYGELGNSQILGNNGISTGAYSSTPVLVSGITNAIQVSVGGSQDGAQEGACATLASGSVECWGGPGYLGDGLSGYSSSPVLVNDISNATFVSEGGDHTCALLSDGTVSCWGEHGYGLNSHEIALSPFPVTGLSKVTEISSGDNHTCAIAMGALSCWGSNNAGQFGDGTTNNSDLPISASVQSQVIQVSAGNSDTCVLLVSQSLSCWGLNDSGDTESTSSDTLSPPTTPNPPTNIEAIPGNGQVSLSWQYPSDDGGSAVQYWLIVGNSNSFYCDSSTNCIISNLSNNTPISFTVAGINSIGLGVASASTSPVTPSPPPSTPQNVRLQPGNGEIDVSWDPSSTNGGQPISRYFVTAVESGSTTGFNCTATETSCKVPGLTNDLTYQVSVIAYNTSGEPSIASAPISGTPTLQIRPHEVTAIFARALGKAISLRWSDGLENSQFQKLMSVVTLANGHKVCETLLTHCTISDLIPGAHYRLYVVVISSTGLSSAPGASNLVETYASPSPPRNLDIVVSAKGVTLHWQAPINDNGARVEFFKVTSTPRSAGCHTLRLTCTISSLKARTSYVFYVQARNKGGFSSTLTSRQVVSH